MRKKNVKRLRRKPTIALVYHHLSDKTKKEYYSREHEIVDEDTKSTVHYMERLFRRRGYHVQVIPVDEGDLSHLKKLKADYVFNLVDSKSMEMAIAKILKRLHIPYSGSSFEAIQTSNNKLRTKRLFEKHKLPTPIFSVLRMGDRVSRRIIPSKFPVMGKPAFEHCSIGITERSIATNYKQFVSIVWRLRKSYRQTLLVEQFIPGKELQVTVLETRDKTVALPIAEIAFRNGIRNKWNIYGFDEKWNKDLPIYKSCHFVSPPKHLKQATNVLIKKDAIRAFYALGLRDYGRFDLRYNPKNRQWYFLEGNANAGFSPGPDDSMTASIQAYGMTLDDFVMQIVKNSIN